MNNKLCEFVRADFHLHTWKDKEFIYKENSDEYLKKYIAQLKEQEIKIGIITNHNKFDLDEYRNLRKKAKREDIFLFPGVELSIKEGKSGHLHVLIAFNPDEWITSNEEFINPFLISVFESIQNRQNANQPCNYDVRHLLEKLETYQKDYFIIFAHAESDQGLLEECAPNLIKKIFELPNAQKRLLGLQKVYKKDQAKKIIKNRIAFVEGSDPKSIKQIGKGNPVYLKVGECSFSAIKYALLNPEERISEKIPEVIHPYIKDITFQGGKFDGVSIEFSPALNSIIGIRGSGKSSLLETLNYGLGISQVSNDTDYKNGLVKETLGAGGKVAITVLDENNCSYRFERILDEEITIFNNNNDSLNTGPNQIIGKLIYFGQKDLSSIEMGQEDQLLEKLIFIDDNANQEIEVIERELIERLKNFQELNILKEEVKEFEEELRLLNDQLKQLNEKKGLEKLNKQSDYKKDLSKIKRLISFYENDFNRVSNVINSFKEASIPQIDFSTFNSDKNMLVKTIQNRINISIEELIEKLKTIELGLIDLNDVKQSILNSYNNLTEEFAEIRRLIEKDGNVNPDVILKKYERVEELKNEIERRNRKILEEDNLISDIRSLIIKRNNKLKDLANVYSEKLNILNNSQDALKIALEYKGNKNQFYKKLKEELSGSGIRDNTYKKISSSFADWLEVIEDYFLNQGIKIKEILKVDSQLNFLNSKIYKNFDKLLQLKTPNLIDIKYHNKPLHSYSLGQRASALLLFLLNQESSRILIIDQPEDDLDNKVIFEEIITSLKRKKSSAQFIFATHNANIPVLGDSEKIICATYQKNKIDLAAGNIDDIETQKCIIDIMEGGVKAFQKREQAYMNWNS